MATRLESFFGVLVALFGNSLGILRLHMRNEDNGKGGGGEGSGGGEE
jgi:hypothetical protein